MKIQETENKYTVETARMQQEMNELVEVSESVNSNAIGFQVPDYQEYEDDE